MPVTVYRVPDEPVLVATFSGDVGADTLREMFQKSAVLLHDEDKMVYRITDFRHINTSIQEVLRAMGAIQQESIPGSSTDPRIRPVLLGDNQWARLARDILQRLTAVEMPVFGSMGEARKYIRVQIARQQG